MTTPGIERFLKFDLNFNVVFADNIISALSMLHGSGYEAIITIPLLLLHTISGYFIQALTGIEKY
ncbi:hypothetical protein AC791_18365 [Klebsiella sp. RIT-PI-d]|uniref:hypothetical protein n=1 Tax=Klebsiella sp. RIT-PI-d TaxID=1681196 RepID=UPI00067666D4|nr:hypothetical protein [Klebsiella sp. RIT-PI-d]KNC06546.1 hypothetical protein AC791_18365 [Klebsiella sp. RIT-PI-d]